MSKDDPKATTESPADPVGPTADGPAENQPPEHPEPTLDADDMARDEPRDGVAVAPQVRESRPTENASQDTSGGDIHQTIAKLEVVQHQLRRLHEAFEAKLKYDAHKEKIIDQLHEELQEYRKDILRQHQHSFVTDVIKIIDDIRKLTSHYQSIDPGEWSPVKLLEHLEQIPFDLEDLFLVRGIVPFRQAAPTFDPARQRIAKKVPTADPLQDKCVASSLRPGYEDEGRVIRPELVAVYDYDSSEAQTTENRSDE